MRSLFSAALFVAIGFQAFAQDPPAAQLSPEARFNRGMNALQGNGPSRNDIVAVDDIRSAAESNFVPAQVVLGYFYENGQIVPRTPGEAARWYRKAAGAGDSLGQYALGRLYFLGLGVQNDMNEAKTWLSQSANQGDAFAQYLLGRVLEDREYRAAPAEYHKAAEQGIPFAQYRFGLMLKNGRGTPIDKPESYAWLLLSFDAGVQDAGQPLRELEADLGSSGTASAKTRSRELMTTAVRSVNAHGCGGWQGEFDEVPTLPPPEIQKFCR